MRAGVLSPAELPHDQIELLGPTGPRRIDTLVHDLVETSERAGDIQQSEEIGEAMLSLRSFMFDRVYLAADTKPNQQRAHEVIRRIFEHLVDEGRSAQEATDYVAGMTDRFALAYAARLEG